MRGMVTAWLGLIVLQTVSTTGSGRVAGAFADVNRLVKRALDPKVPAIPDRRDGAASPAPDAVANGAAAAARPPFLRPSVAHGAAAAARPNFIPHS